MKLELVDLSNPPYLPRFSYNELEMKTPAGPGVSHGRLRVTGWLISAGSKIGLGSEQTDGVDPGPLSDAVATGHTEQITNTDPLNPGITRRLKTILYLPK